MPRAFLIETLAGLLLTLNARRALRGPILLVPAFFASWLVVELAPQLLVLHVVGVAVVAALGGAAAWPGWIAIGVGALTTVLLWGIVRESVRAGRVLDEALEPLLGADEARRAVAWKEFAFPFKLWSRALLRTRDVPYAPPGTRRYRLDVWRPKSAKTEGANRPCLLYVPGGAWTVGISNKNHQGKPLIIEMASRGWVCFSMNYPVSPRATFPDHIVAVKRAIAWIRDHAHEYGGDARFVMVAGNSAGGHLSSLAALTGNDPGYQPGFEGADTTLQAAAPLYGVYDMTGEMIAGLPARRRRHKQGMLRQFERMVAKQRLERDRSVFERGSPWHRVGAHAPPFFVIHGAMDTLAMVEEARAFVSRLREVSDQPVIYAELPGTQHAFDTFVSIRSVQAVRAIGRFGEWAHSRWQLTGGARPDRRQDPAAPSPTSQA